MARSPPLTLLVAIGLLAPASGAPFCNSGCPKVSCPLDIKTYGSKAITALALAEALVGKGLTLGTGARGAKFIGDITQAGTFKSGKQTMGIDEGVVLSTGIAKDIPCDSNKGSSSSGTGTMIAGGDYQDPAMSKQCKALNGGNDCTFHDTTYLGTCDVVGWGCCACVVVGCGVCAEDSRE